jgi:hypothetical protein
MAKRIGNPNFVKGKSGSPATQFKPGDKPRLGKKKIKLPNLDEALAYVLGENIKDDITALEIVLKALRAKAVRGDVKAIDLLLSRAYGKPKQFIEQVNKNQVDLTGLSEEELFLVAKLQEKQKDNGADPTDPVS